MQGYSSAPDDSRTRRRAEGNKCAKTADPDPNNSSTDRRRWLDAVVHGEVERGGAEVLDLLEHVHEDIHAGHGIVGAVLADEV
eukprot:9197255-Pyramimonas_sp.AAC.1